MQRIRKIKPLYFKLRLLTEFCWNILEYEKELLKIMELFIIGEEKFSSINILTQMKMLLRVSNKPASAYDPRGAPGNAV